MLVAGLAGELGIKTKTITINEGDWAVLKTGDTNLWPLQITEDGDGAAVLTSNSAHLLGAIVVVLWAAVREVEADDVDAGENQAFQR